MSIAYASIPILGLVDTGVAGRLNSVAALGALAIGAIIFNFLFTIFSFLRSSVLGLTAQAFGRADNIEIDAIFIRGAIIALIGGVLVFLGSPTFLAIGSAAFNLQGELGQMVASYFHIRAMGMPLALLNLALCGHFLGLGRSKIVLLLQLLLNCTNMVFSIYLGLDFDFGLFKGLDLGVEGIAYGSLIGEGVACFIGLAIFLHSRAARSNKWPSLNIIFDKHRTVQFWSLNRDISIRTMCLFFSFALFTKIGTLFGETSLAANAVLLQFMMLSAFMLDGFATAAEQMAGQSLGAKDKHGFVLTIKKTGLCSAAFAVSITAVYFVLGDELISLLVKEASVVDQANQYFYWAIITPMTGAAAFLLDGVFIGASWGADMRNGMLLSAAMFTGLASIAYWTDSNAALWFALHCFLGLRALYLYAILNKNIERSFAIDR